MVAKSLIVSLTLTFLSHDAGLNKDLTRVQDRKELEDLMAGFHEIVTVTGDGVALEGTQSNFFVVQNNEVS